MKILDRYIIGKFLGTFFFAIGLLMVIIVIFDYTEKMDDFTQLQAPFKAILIDYIFNFIPYFINQFIGLFTFISVIFFTSKLAYQTEIIAMLSGGMSFRRLMWPYFLSAATITVISLILSLFVIPPANAQRFAFESRYLRKNQNQSIEAHIYRQVSPGTFVYVRGFDASKNEAQYIALESYENNEMVSMLDAASPTFDDETLRWSAEKYTTRRFEGGREIFQQHDQRLDTLIGLDATEFGNVEMLTQSMPIGKLNKFIKQQKSKGSEMVGLFEVERAQRFSYPFSTFILTLIGVSLSSRKVRGGTGVHIGVGITLCFTYILLARFAQEFAKGGVVSPTIAVWLPNVLFALIAVYLYRQAPK